MRRHPLSHILLLPLTILMCADWDHHHGGGSSSSGDGGCGGHKKDALDQILTPVVTHPACTVQVEGYERQTIGCTFTSQKSGSRASGYTTRYDLVADGTWLVAGDELDYQAQVYFTEPGDTLPPGEVHAWPGTPLMLDGWSGFWPPHAPGAHPSLPGFLATRHLYAELEPGNTAALTVTDLAAPHGKLAGSMLRQDPQTGALDPAHPLPFTVEF